MWISTSEVIFSLVRQIRETLGSEKGLSGQKSFREITLDYPDGKKIEKHHSHFIARKDHSPTHDKKFFPLELFILDLKIIIDSRSKSSIPGLVLCSQKGVDKAIFDLGIRLPLTGPKSPKSGKDGFRVKNPHFPPPQKRVFRVKKSPFSL